MKNENITVLYIAGNGHSGSTLLDIILGSSPDIFSAGELTFITRDSIFEEYCSCGCLIKECQVWSKIVNVWLEKASITLENYKRLRLRYERNKVTLITFKNVWFPSQDFEIYCNATYQLFKAIQQVTGKNIIIDSSKSPQRISILKKSVNLQVIHICRNSKGVLNSAKKAYKKDIQSGIEKETYARRTSKVLIEWVFVNFVTELFCLGVNSKKIKYNSYIKNIKLLQKVHPAIQIQEKNLYSTPHMLAGNKLRLNKNIKVDTTSGFMYKRLTKKQSLIASFFEKLFPFWS